MQICAPDRIAGISYGNYSPALISTLAGATYYEFDLRRNGAGAVAEKLAEHEITVLNCKVTTFRQLMRSAAGRLRYPHLRIVRLAGEPPTPGDILSAKGILTDRCVLSNQFGSTESYIATTFAVTTDIAAHLETVPAGFPNEGVEILIVDEAGKTVPTGEEGEIVVQSRHLSPGYWNRPNLTRERFLPDPTGGDRRLYQMGDIGYLDNDGCLHVLGRRDDQVKIRSHKVRISQVEAVLLATAGVDMGAVVARSGPDGSLRLVAYVVAASSKITVSQIRSQMESMLPLAMVPAVFVFVDELPLTVSQKVDRRALPSPPTARPRLSIPYMAPRTRIESTLVQIWGEVLGFDAVGIHDRFLELGGDSLLASQIVSRVVRVLPVQVSHAEIFSAGTVADMSLVITESLMLSTSDVSIEQVIAAAERTP